MNDAEKDREIAQLLVRRQALVDERYKLERSKTRTPQQETDKERRLGALARELDSIDARLKTLTGQPQDWKKVTPNK